MWRTAQRLTSGLAFELGSEQFCQPSPGLRLVWPLETGFLPGGVGPPPPPAVTLQREDLVAQVMPA